MPISLGNRSDRVTYCSNGREGGQSAMGPHRGGLQPRLRTNPHINADSIGGTTNGVRPMTRFTALIAGMAGMLACLPGLTQESDFVPVTDAMLQDPDPADWLMWRRNAR